MGAFDDDVMDLGGTLCACVTRVDRWAWHFDVLELVSSQFAAF